MSEYIKIYKNIGLQVYDFIYYNKHKDNYLFNNYKNKLKDEFNFKLELESDIKKDKFIKEDNKKKKKLSELKTLIKNNYDFNSNCPFEKLKKLNSDYNNFKKFIIKNNNFNSHIFEIIRKNIKSINKFICKINLNSFKLTDAKLFEFINNFKISMNIDKCKIYDKNFFNIMLENNKSIKIDYINKYLEFEILFKKINEDFCSNADLIFNLNFGKFNEWISFELNIDYTITNIINNNNYIDNYITNVFNYNNLESLLKSNLYSFGFIIYSNDISYKLDIKNIFIKNIEVNFDILYIGDILFYVIYFDNTISNVHEFIDKLYNIKKTNNYVALELQSLKNEDIKINYYNYDKKYENKICISNISIDRLSK